MHQTHLFVSALADVLAAPPGPGLLAVKTLPQVVDSARAWIVGIIAAVASLFMAIAALRYASANGDPAAIEQAKSSFRAGLTGYAMAVLAPVILQVLKGILGA